MYLCIYILLIGVTKVGVTRCGNWYIHLYSPYNIVAQATQEKYDKWKEKNTDGVTLFLTLKNWLPS